MAGKQLKPLHTSAYFIFQKKEGTIPHDVFYVLIDDMDWGVGILYVSTDGA